MRFSIDVGSELELKLYQAVLLDRNDHGNRFMAKVHGVVQTDKAGVPTLGGPIIPAIELEGDQLGELGRDVCHRIFCSTQAASRGEQGADFAESFVRRAMHDGDEQVTR